MNDKTPLLIIMAFVVCCAIWEVYKYYKGKKKPSCFKKILNHIKDVLKGLLEMLKNGHAPRS